MKKKLLFALSLITIIMASITYGAYATTDIKVLINGQAVDMDILIEDGTTYVPLRMVSETFGADVQWDETTSSIHITMEAPKTTAVSPPSPAVVTKRDLPYTILADNGMSLTINSYSATKKDIIFNFTVTNHSSISDKGKLMASTWHVDDGDNTLYFMQMDSLFWHTNYIGAGKSITGNIAYQGLTNDNKTFSLQGKLWKYKLLKYMDAEEFNITFSAE